MGRRGKISAESFLRLACISLLFCTVSSWGSTEDPFGSISIDELLNGLKIVFAGSGSPRAVAIELRGLSGWDAEPKDEPGIALLTQQAVLRGQNGASETELFRQAGGDITHGVEGRYSYVRAGVPSIK